MTEQDIDVMGRGMLADSRERSELRVVKHWDPIAEKIVEDIKSDGPISRAIASKFGLDRKSR